MLRIPILAAAVVLAACSGQTTTQKSAFEQTQVPVTPKGTIVIKVTDLSNFQPLADATVTVIGGSAPTLTTDANGLATFNDAVVNSYYTLVIEKAGYLKQTRYPNSVRGSTGVSPLAAGTTNITVELFKADAQLKGVVFLPDGNPAANTTVVIDQNYDGLGDSLLSTQTGADGSFTLTGIGSYPSGVYHQIAAYPPNSGVVPYFTSLYFYPGETQRIFIDLYQDSSTEQRVVNSNLFIGSLAPASDIKLTFANPVNPTNFDNAANDMFQLYSNITGDRFAVTATWTSTTQVSLKPIQALRAGDQMQLNLAVTSASTSMGPDANFYKTLYFQVRPDTVTPIAAQVTNLVIENPSYAGTPVPARFDWNTNAYTLKWSAAAGATRYAIYAKDTKNNPDWVKVTEVDSEAAPAYETTFSLPQAFDNFPGSGGTQPLAQGNVVSFSVVGIDVYGYQAPLATAPTVTASDNIQPTRVGGLVALTKVPTFNVVDAINDDTTPAQLLFRIRYSEPMDTASPPAFTGSGSPAPTTLWQGAWDPTLGQFTYTLTLTIGGGVDASGNVLVRGGKDAAGNVVLDGDIQTSLSGFKTQSLSATFEDTAGCALGTAWTASNTGNMPGPSAVLATGQGTSSNNKCAAVLGAPTNAAAATGVSKISQDVNLTPIPTGAPWYYIVKATTRGFAIGAGPLGVQRCDVTDTSDVAITTLVTHAATYASVTSVFNYSVPSPVTTLRVSCKVDNSAGTPTANNTSMYVDDLFVYLYKPGNL